MPVSPDYARELARSVRDVYERAESRLIKTIAAQVAAGLQTESWQDAKFESITRLMREVDIVIDELQRGAPGAVEKAIGTAYRRGIAVGGADLDKAGFKGAFGGAGRTDAITRLLGETMDSLLDAPGRIRRWARDAYDKATTEATSAMLTGTMARTDAARDALRSLAADGVKSFTDKSGRNWELASYAEMATRTASGRAMVDGHTQRLKDLGQDLVVISDAPEECEICRPYEGEVLSLSGEQAGLRLESGRVVLASMADAQADGLFHPNAILGDHSLAAVGNVENAVRAWYEGPSIELTTARGIRLTVSPNHPVLTARGWVDAQGLREGDELFHAKGARWSLDAPKVSDEFDDVEALVSDCFGSLESRFPKMRVAAAGDDLHGDGKFCQGEIDVVVADDRLLSVADASLVKECGYYSLGRSGVQFERGSSDSPGDLGLLGVSRPVRRPLPDRYASGLEPTAQGRIADSEYASEVLAGLPCEVEGDELVSVNREWFRGHAYDFQTSFGGYFLNSILVHNCRHSQSIYLDGVTETPKNTPDPEGDKLRQRQRAYERRIREWKRRLIVDEEALGKDDPRTKATRKRLRTAQSDFKGWRDEHGRKNVTGRTNITVR